MNLDKLKTGSFEDAVKALNQGGIVATPSQLQQGKFVFKQKSAILYIDRIPSITSLPDSVKIELLERAKVRETTTIRYDYQYAIVDSESNITSFVPTVQDIDGVWMILHD